MSGMIGRTPGGAAVLLRWPRDGEQVPDSSSEYDEWGERLPLEETAGTIHRLVVECDGEAVGQVTWHRTHYGPNLGSCAWNIGIGIAAAHRGRGIGAVAQRLLAEHLLATTPLDRVEASTDVTNVAEQRALERAGFTREGVLRSAQERVDGRHDLVSYSLVRSDLPAIPHGTVAPPP